MRFIVMVCLFIIVATLIFVELSSLVSVDPHYSLHGWCGRAYTRTVCNDGPWDEKCIGIGWVSLPAPQSVFRQYHFFAGALVEVSPSYARRLRLRAVSSLN